MEEIKFFTPWPPSVNSMYTNRISTSTVNYGNNFAAKKRGRKITPDARAYKKYVSDLIFFSFPRVKFGSTLMEASILSAAPNDKRVRDNHNNTKPLFDAIEASGIIENDSQIVKSTLIPLPPFKKGFWFVNLKRYRKDDDDQLITNFFNTYQNILEKETFLHGI